MVPQLRKLAFKLINSTTILGPAWKQCLADLKIKYRQMPRDVSNRWNSTFDMLDFALEYQKGVDQMTSNKTNNLRRLEMDSDEWELANELRNVLEVSSTAYAE